MSWDQSANAWINNLGEHGDFGRQFVVDNEMRERLRDRNFSNALDIGCGEGRFCRIMNGYGIVTIGIDPTLEFIKEATRRDPDGDYRLGRAEDLKFGAECFDLVVSYHSLINIPDLEQAVTEMVRVLKPGGTLLISNLTSFTSACANIGWVRDADGRPLYYAVDNYLEEGPVWVNWRGIRVQNWHRPLSTYMKIFLKNCLQLKYFSEPRPSGGDLEIAERNRRVPYHVVMEWAKVPA